MCLHLAPIHAQQDGPENGILHILGKRPVFLPSHFKIELGGNLNGMRRDIKHLSMQREGVFKAVGTQ